MVTFVPLIDEKTKNEPFEGTFWSCPQYKIYANTDERHIELESQTAPTLCVGPGVLRTTSHSPHTPSRLLWMGAGQLVNELESVKECAGRRRVGALRSESTKKGEREQAGPGSRWKRQTRAEGKSGY